MPYSDEAISNPNKPMSYSAEAISNPNKPMSYSAEAILNPNELMSYSDEAVLNPNESKFIPDETVPNSTEQVPNLSESMAHKADEISSNNLYDPVEVASFCEDEDTKSTEDQEVEDVFIKLALKKGIKVGKISPPTRNDVKAVSVPESSQRENFFSQKDTEVENLFIRRALEKGIKVGRLSPTNTGYNAEPVHLPEVSVKEEEKDQDIEELFVRLALEKGIKVGNVSPVNETITQHYAKDTITGEEFEKRALRNGIRLGGSHVSTMEHSNENTTSFPPVRAIPGHVANDTDVLKILAPKPNTNIAFLNGDWLNPLTTPMAPSHDGEGVFGPNAVPPFARYNGTQFNTLVKFDTESHERMDWTNNEAGYRKTTSLRQDSFEELAKRNGIRVGETLKRKVESQTQTENSFKSQDTQTIGLIKVGNASIQVDVTKEAFKAEYDEWMQEELSLIDPKASSFRELFLLEEEAREEAERRLAVEMDENVKAQRNTKILIDELKDQLANKEEAIEKLNKELKSLKKQKDSEIKRLTKEIKQKDEDLKTATNENSLKDVVIENMREIAKDQNEMVEKMEEKLKAMEKQMENERKISESLLKIESSKNISLQTKGADEWQVVKGRSSGTKATMKPNSSRQYHQIDGLSGFDDREYQRYNSRLPSDTTTYMEQRDPSEEIKPGKSLASKNEGFLSTSQDVPLHLRGAQNSVTSDIGVSTAYNQQSPSGDCVPRLSRESSHATGCTSVPSLPPPGIHMPRLPRELSASVCAPNTSSTNSVCTINGTFNTANVLNSNGLYTSSDTLTSPSIMQQNLPRVPYPTPGSVGNTSLLHPVVSHQVLAGGPYSIPTVSDATMPSSVVTNQDLPRVPYPTPGSVGNANLLHPAVSHQVLAGGPYSIHTISEATTPISVINQDLPRVPYPSPASSCDAPLLPPGITVDPALRQALPVVSSKNKTTNKFSSFDKLMDALRDSFPDHSRPSLMVYLKKAKEAFGTNGFKGKQISEIVDKVSQVIDQE
ncbi:uncharacterized protein LOC116302945 [Actinia tenebrosa]|uniref:Uncharacterized protein LOC116302945 n=1 Tax=Actinia tenebrosa TaxID=6105 RepID=A0A6P8IN09_ACTTE|nr:uncharacterized protein LOC116302945 [Actinia tenebrosa]